MSSSPQRLSPRTKRGCRISPSQQADQPQKKARRSINTDIAYETKVDAVVTTFKLVAQGKKKGQADKAVAQAIGCTEFAVRNWRRVYERKGVAGLESKRNGNQNASKFTTEVAVCIKAQMQANRCMTERELAEQIPGIKDHIRTSGKNR